MKLSDFRGVLNKSTAVVESVENPHGDYYVLKLRPEKELKWNAGEHAIYTLPGKAVEGKKWRAFSVASIDNEGYLMIGTRTGKEISSFKKHIIHMKKGEKVNLRGPFGWFKIMDDKSPMVLVASGVGITPIRAILRKLENTSTREIHVVYSSSDYYLFGEEIESIAAGNPNISLYKTGNREETWEKLDDLAKNYKNESYYYVSGSFPVIRSIRSHLKEMNIRANRIIYDPFLGY